MESDISIQSRAASCEEHVSILCYSPPGAWLPAINFYGSPPPPPPPPPQVLCCDAWTYCMTRHARSGGQQALSGVRDAAHVGEPAPGSALPSSGRPPSTAGAASHPRRGNRGAAPSRPWTSGDGAAACAGGAALDGAGAAEQVSARAAEAAPPPPRPCGQHALRVRRQSTPARHRAVLVIHPCIQLGWHVPERSAILWLILQRSVLSVVLQLQYEFPRTPMYQCLGILAAGLRALVLKRTRRAIAGITRGGRGGVRCQESGLQTGSEDAMHAIIHVTFILAENLRKIYCTAERMHTTSRCVPPVERPR